MEQLGRPDNHTTEDEFVLFIFSFLGKEPTIWT